MATGYPDAPPTYDESQYAGAAYNINFQDPPYNPQPIGVPYAPPPQPNPSAFGYVLPGQSHVPGQSYPPEAYQSSYGQSPGGHPADSSIAPEPAVVDVEGGKNDTFAAFDDKSIRLGFIKKVFGILSIQLLVTGGILAIFVLVEDVHDFVEDHDWLVYVAVVLYLVCAFSLICVESLRRKVPHNLILLALVTLSMSFMLGVIASYYDADEVLIAVGITFGIVVVMCGFGYQTKFDFTTKLGLMMCLTLAILFFGIITASFGTDDVVSTVYASLGALIFSMWLVIDIQMMMGGKRKFQMNPEEYIFAALNIYLDIVQILLFILMILRCANK